MNLIQNWDQTGIKLVLSTGRTMEEQAARRVKLAGLNDKWYRYLQIIQNHPVKTTRQIALPHVRH